MVIVIDQYLSLNYSLITLSLILHCLMFSFQETAGNIVRCSESIFRERYGVSRASPCKYLWICYLKTWGGHLVNGWAGGDCWTTITEASSRAIFKNPEHPGLPLILNVDGHSAIEFLTLLSRENFETALKHFIGILDRLHWLCHTYDIIEAHEPILLNIVCLVFKLVLN